MPESRCERGRKKEFGSVERVVFLLEGERKENSRSTRIREEKCREVTLVNHTKPE